MLQKHFQLVLGDCEAQIICCVDHENDCLALGVIVLPKSAVLALATHVEDCEVDFILLECLDLEADCRCQFFLLVLLRLQKVDHCRFARVVETNNDDLRLLRPHVPHNYFLLILN